MIATNHSGYVTLSHHSYPWRAWQGEALNTESVIAFDCETAMVDDDDPSIPALAMVAVSDGTTHVIVHPDDVAGFIDKHAQARWVAHNAAFDFWVIDAHLKARSARDTRQHWWRTLEANRLHDTMLLASLVGIATNDDDQRGRLSLDQVAAKWCDIALDKSDPFRTRYGETIGKPWGELAAGFFRYAIADAIATWMLYRKLAKTAHQIRTAHQLSSDYGLLSQDIQVKAAISLAQATRNGLTIDTDRAESLREQLAVSVQESIEELEAIESEIWHRYKRDNTTRGIEAGQRKANKETGLPSMNQSAVRGLLQSVADQHGITVPLCDASDDITLSIKQFWAEHRHVAPIVDAFCSYGERTKTLQFFKGLKSDHIHPRYTTLVRTGRTSCSGPNIQQLPKAVPIREAITARPGHVLLSIDYSAIELRTLAAVCLQRYGHSKLAEVFKSGEDPHATTAASIADVSLDEFNQLPNKKELRQQAKAINFGFPGGLGATAFRSYARLSYGIDMTEEQATNFRDQFKTTYPEQAVYLASLPGVQTENVTTMTGRLRAGVTYSQARNAPFQGLAADGAKLAMWELTKRGYRVVAFVHDEFIIELPMQADYRQDAQRIQQLIEAPMQKLLGEVPVASEYAVMHRWHKQAEAVYSDDGRLIPWEPPTTPPKPSQPTPVIDEPSKPTAPPAGRPAVAEYHEEPAPIPPVNEQQTLEAPTPEATMVAVADVDYGPNLGDESNPVHIIHGDSCEVLPRVGLFDFLFADPPFNIGHGYTGFDDNMKASDYESFTRRWIEAAWESLTPRGVMAIHGPDHVVDLYSDATKSLGIRHHRVAWVNWTYRFGQCKKHNWIDSRCHCWILAKDTASYTFNSGPVLVDSDRASKYGDKRTTTTETPGKRLPLTIWGIDEKHWGRVQGNNGERWKKHPNQLPLRYLQRLILAYTNPGDRIADPFNGSGTTGMVCRHEARQFIGIDVSQPNVESARQRIIEGFYRAVEPTWGPDQPLLNQ